MIFLIHQNSIYIHGVKKFYIETLKKLIYQNSIYVHTIKYFMLQHFKKIVLPKFKLKWICIQTN